MCCWKLVQVDEDDEEAVSFIQLDNPRKHINVLSARLQNVGAAESLEPYKRALVEDILRRKATELKSQTLLRLASRVAADPFVKIKKLIQEMIERLLQEAADEATHKGWCDKSLTKAKKTREDKSNLIRGLNEQLSASEAKRDGIQEEIDELDKQLSELQDTMEKETKMRSDESAENAATIKEAEEAKEAVEEAITILDDFYKKAKSALIQADGIDDDMPDPGFSGNYTGMANGGVMGMMEVIKSDFERTITETEAAEKSANKDFTDFQHTTKVSVSTKTITKSAKETELTEVNSAIAEDKTSMSDEQELLDKSLQELMELQPACIDTGMSYQERVAKREEEIDALKSAMCQLDAEGVEADC